MSWFSYILLPKTPKPHDLIINKYAQACEASALQTPTEYHDVL